MSNGCLIGTLGNRIALDRVEGTGVSVGYGISRRKVFIVKGIKRKDIESTECAMGGLSDRTTGDFSCNREVQRAIPILKQAYGDNMHRVLHVGPDTCSVISSLLREKETEAWGLEPYDIEDVDHTCKLLVHRGIVRVADIKFPLPYRAKSFPLVIISDALDYLSPKYLNRTVPELARISSDGLVIFTEYDRPFI
ncbi:putative pectin methylesterase CGR2 [Sesamum alatum]|uniref:Pectin methylesterase CGR2 n=1 Tax=Sesamum alatum TaxID=300844 RepID=A0AAE1YET0_9LAMI|nr:putative pectin methylesterase CGR2 [Sesamum alatum]